ncbi:MAG: TIGR00645 family protein [Deltaproteobacteria bacterium]|nr:TIGR00645 family protein [Deltaproteobacteria bacterium]
MKKFEKLIEQTIFASRWFQVPMYLGLIVAGVIYAWRFLMELVHLISSAQSLSEEHLMLSVLTLVDITMVANLLVMVIIGGYATFVSRLDIISHVDRPDWLQKVDAGTIKVKMAGSLVGVSGIHLLKSFINIDNRPIESVKWQIIIHVVFLFSTLFLAATEWILYKKSGDKV